MTNKHKAKAFWVHFLIFGDLFLLCFIQDALRVIEHSPHNLSGALLQVSLFDESEKDNQESHDEDVEELEEGVTIIISGISSSTTEDAVWNYFENSRRSGGGEVKNIELNAHAGEAVITFLEVKGTSAILLASSKPSFYC